MLVMQLDRSYVAYIDIRSNVIFNLAWRYDKGHGWVGSVGRG